MFIENKYTKWYYGIINCSRNRELLGYTELHHIIPKSLGGLDDYNNIAKLTAREHLLCHILLIKMTTGRSRYKMITALWAMTNLHNQYHQREKISPRQYEKLKQDVAHLRSINYSGVGNPFSGKKHTEETLQKMRKPKAEGHRENLSRSQKLRFENQPGTFKNRKHTEETLKKLQKPKTESQKLAQSKAMKGKYLGRVPHNKNKTYEELYGVEKSKELKKKVSQPGEKNGFFGKKHSPEQREKKRQEKLTAQKIKCSYCNKETDPMNYARWHGNNCKHNK